MVGHFHRWQYWVLMPLTRPTAVCVASWPWWYFWHFLLIPWPWLGGSAEVQSTPECWHSACWVLIEASFMQTIFILVTLVLPHLVTWQSVVRVGYAVLITHCWCCKLGIRLYICPNLPLLITAALLLLRVNWQPIVFPPYWSSLIDRNNVFIYQYLVCFRMNLSSVVNQVYRWYNSYLVAPPG